MHFDITQSNGSKVKVICLTEKEAKQLYKYNDRIYLSDAEVLLFNQDKLEVISEQLENQVWMYPAGIIEGLNVEDDGLFKKYSVNFNKVDVAFTSEEVQNGKNLSVPQKLSIGKKKLRVPEDQYFDKGTIVNLSFPNGFSTELYDTRIEVDYKAACARFYIDDRICV